MILRLFDRFRRALLPDELYLEYGHDMRTALEDRCEAAGTSSPLAVWSVIFHETRDLFSTAFSQYRETGSPASAGPHPGASRQAIPPDPEPPATIGAAGMIDTVYQDLRSAVRTLRREPAMTAVCVATLALGIGAVTAVFAVVDAVLLKPLPYDDGDKLAAVWTDFGVDLPRNWLSGPEYRELLEFGEGFEDVAVVALDSSVITGDDEPLQIPAAIVSGNLFEVLRTDAAHGRLLTPQDDAVGADAAVVISDGLWKRRFGADESIVGSSITLNEVPFTVVGILPPDFRLHHPGISRPETLDLWLPLQMRFGTAYEQLSRGSHFLVAFARLKDDVPMVQLAAEMERVTAAVVELNPNAYAADWRFYANPLRADLVEDSRAALVILLVAVACVLMIACVNVANLQLARSSTRQGEIAIRAALGAGRIRILRQLIVENLVLAALGTVAGLLLAFWFVEALVALVPNRLPRGDAVSVDLTALAFAASLAAGTALLFGLFPSVAAMRTRSAAALSVGVRGAKGGKVGRRLRAGLVVAEISLALVLAVSAGLLLRSFVALNRADPGYDTESILTLQLSLPSSYDPVSATMFWDELLSELRALPRVTAAGGISILPLSGGYSSGTTLVEESELVELQQGSVYPFIEADKRYITTGYFDAMGVQLLRGRRFDATDSADGAPVAIVDEIFARRFWGDEDPLGRRLATEYGFDQETRTVNPYWREVVGVVRHSNHYEVGATGREQAYVPVPQMPTMSMYLAVRASGDLTAVAASVRERVWAIDDNIPVSNESTMEALAYGSLARSRFNSLLFSLFAGAALVLTAIGIYGVISYSVSQRTGEIGVRMALGADRGAVRRLVLRQSATLAVAGIAIGSLVAVFAVPLLGSMLYGVEPTDVATHVAVAAILGAVALIAAWIPAGRATRIEPVVALRRD